MILTLTGTTFRAEQPGRRRLLASATLLLAITAGAIGARILLASNIRAKAPTLDILQKLFGLRGEDIDDAVLYEVWGELWLACALVAGLVLGCHRATHRCPSHPASGASPWDIMAAQPAQAGLGTPPRSSSGLSAGPP